MNLFTEEDLQLLAPYRDGPCISIYMPTERGGPEKRECDIRLKNLLREARKHLRDQDLREAEADELLEPGQRLLQDMPFLEHDADALAMFIAPELFRYYRLPAQFNDLVVVSEEFHVKPLIPLLTENGTYFVLALSQNDVRLIQCTRFSLRQVNLGNTPTSMQEALRFDEVQSMHQGHSGGPTGPGSRGGMVFHSRADDSDRAVHKENIHQFLHQVENGVTGLIGAQDAPLVLAGVEEVRAIYAHVNTYGNLLEEGIDGNPDRLKPAELHAAGWRVVEPKFTKAREDAIDYFQQLSGGEKAVNKLPEVLGAAEDGRVQILLADLERQQWGTYEPTSRRVVTHDEERAGDEDLVNRAALKTLLHGGTVFALESQKMPDGELVAAVLRF